MLYYSCGCHRATPVLVYGSELRNHRREFQRYIGSSIELARLSSMQETEVRRLLLRILEEPRETEQHIQRATAAISLGVAYGYIPALRGKDELLELAEKASDTFSAIFDGGAWMVDILPFCNVQSSSYIGSANLITFFQSTPSPFLASRYGLQAKGKGMA